MSRNTHQIVCTMFLSVGLYAAVLSLSANASSEEELNLSSDQPSIEILALSRGRGVPETTMKVFQEIMEVADTALESKTVLSVRQERIGLEGEARLCIVFQDNQALAAIGNQIRNLATNIDLLQINDNSCSGNQEEQPNKEKSL